ncbi:8-oxo-dGTP pyrophosphatase MutT, NUDIX family [Cyclobacterium xiamenense]|uniref:GDP-mannose pyrophosphatase n=1 Tax=Cyclobacterium xiamenense TaxID=1297121 RepID=A0A1H6ZIF1_9BACT|nr:NUDIX hydrolase [Cyclobacterium xiamenense]SEJ49340.1 8-oxo-dGTP pyrophosphatase MutT, NUDIX family [Cyclobacterium xiamenense]
MKNPWTTISTKEVYDNPWIRVAEHQVITPTQSRGIYGTVRFKNRAVAIVPLDRELHTWIVGQYRYTLDEYSWEIPMGGGPLEEDVLDSAKRELKEETGLTAGKWSELMKIHTSNSVTDEVGFVFIAEELVPGETEFDPTEDLQVRRLPFADVLRMVMEGEITDGISVAAVLKTAIRLKMS